MLHQVRNGYAVHLPGGKTYKEGEVFEPPPEVLIGQSWKIEPVKLAEPALTVGGNGKKTGVPAVELPRPAPEPCQILRDGAWKGRRCFIIGGGPSLKGCDFSRLKGELVIGVNRAFEHIDPAIIFSMDSRFCSWTMGGKFGPEVKDKYLASPALKVWLDTHGYIFGPGITKIPTITGTSPGTNEKIGDNFKDGMPYFGNSGLAALNMAIILGADPIYLLGFDLGVKGKFQTWWHDGYPSVQRDDVYKDYRHEFELVAPDIRRRGVKVINLNPDSGIKCFEFGEFPGPLPQAPLFISFYTPGLYADKAARLRRSLHFLGLEYQIEEVEDRGSWDANTKFKAEFILRMLEAHPGRNIVWVDADAVVRTFPTLFFEMQGEVGVHYRNGKELLSGTMFFQNAPRVQALVKSWIKENAENPKEWEQRTLQRLLTKPGRFGRPRVKIENLPATYCQIFDTMADAGEPVIEQFQASREAKGKK